MSPRGEAIPHLPKGRPMHEVYRVRPGMVHETIDGETVVLSLETGTYFSLTAAAGLAWSLLEEGTGVERMRSVLGRRYSGDPDAIGAAVRDFLATLEKDGLIERHAGGMPEAEVALEAGSDPFPGLGIQRYSDVEELLMIDPVHEVDEAGWPLQPNKN